MSVTRRASVALLLCTSACFHSTAPPGYLVTVNEAQATAFGGWAEVDLLDGRTVEGELIAATPDSIHVLGLHDWFALPTSALRRVTVTGYRVPLDAFWTAGALGGISTLSHGWFLILSAPMWAVVTSTAAASASRAPRVRSTNHLELRKYARFPQGLPPDVDRLRLLGRMTPR
jgi:hypothetical protein